jgi:hypothetical protein
MDQHDTPRRPIPLTADAIHNWDAPYIQQQYRDLPADVKAAAQAAMRRHHQRGTDAQDEADTINHTYQGT